MVVLNTVAKNCRVIPCHVVPLHLRLPPVGKHQGGEDAEKRGLPRPVRSDDAVQFAFVYGKAHTVQCLHLAVCLV